jgi:hypothetical protein
MRFRALATTAWIALMCAGSGAAPGHAAELVWQVENPFRFFKATREFSLHEAAFNAVRGNPGDPLPADIVWRTERRLNDPDCKDSSTPDKCAASAGKRWEQSRLGWAAQTLGQTCYDSDGLPHRYLSTCDRKYSWGSAKEDYVLPEAHTVNLHIAPEHMAGLTGDCVWTWQPRKAGGRAETRKLACNAWLTIPRVPYSLDRNASGVSVTVKLPDGRELADRAVVVEDLFIVALGDSFASGESNPDRPVTFSPAREMVYDPALAREELAYRGIEEKKKSGFDLASGDDQYNPKVLPRRYLADEAAEKYFPLSSPEFQAEFDKAGARWLSRDCHRSQYGYPFRVGIELALENRHRSVTLASFTCSGAEVTNGLFQEMDAREGFSDSKAAKVRPQLDQLSDLICRGGAGGRTQGASYVLPVFKTGSTSITQERIAKTWCPPQSRKRPIDVVLMSIGGNDVGFGGLLAYAMTDSAGDLAPIATWIGSQIRFGPDVTRVYLPALAERMKAVKDALRDGFGVEPSRVLQSSYEPAQFDETGGLCGSQPTLGMDVHPGLKINRARLQEASDFLREFLGRLECISSTKGRNCPANLATGAGTGFTLVVDHLPEFAKRGLCARDPKRALADGIAMRMPRKAPGGDEFKPYSPAAELPYAHHWRLFRTPNDAFLAANTHREGISTFDILQPAYAGLFSGAIHPTAEGHAIVADHMVRHVRALIEKLEVAETAAR